MDRDAATRLAISRLHFPVTTLGPGRRVGIWFQGCSIRCDGCLSLDTWSAGADDQWVSVQALVGWMVEQAASEADGVTISGGEPFDQPDGLLPFLRQVRRHPALEGMEIMAYSGYTLAVLRRRHRAVLDMLDAVITGPYVDGSPTTLPWRGSANQELTLLTDRARARFHDGAAQGLQVSADGGRVWITGVPRREDLHRLEAQLAARGVRVENVSWRL
ncbi:MAG TPA: 4Fe-4S single cluster domain-containing protein [Acidimicrobiales bacterium]|nr:4Fe-4S single cluster domain-containing protein [Acidimicrobiales bacterium]